METQQQTKNEYLAEKSAELLDIIKRLNNNSDVDKEDLPKLREEFVYNTCYGIFRDMQNAVEQGSELFNFLEDICMTYESNSGEWRTLLFFKYLYAKNIYLW